MAPPPSTLHPGESLTPLLSCVVGKSDIPETCLSFIEDQRRHKCALTPYLYFLCSMSRDLAVLHGQIGIIQIQINAQWKAHTLQKRKDGGLPVIYPGGGTLNRDPLAWLKGKTWFRSVNSVNNMSHLGAKFLETTEGLLGFRDHPMDCGSVLTEGLIVYRSDIWVALKYL
uniref:Uncharacterized protein n=1 Tax=Coccidioides posadasii RMSCC 3488 TaxID=454284 RepID=A0A0J6F5B2_COCPO|nr:hypothetical protein CPAG_00481 [Coccidioides posadasii RMSCC 3488]